MVFLNAEKSQYTRFLFDFRKISFHTKYHGVSPVVTCLLLMYIKKMVYSSRSVVLVFRFTGVNILLKITTFSFLKDFLTKRAYLKLTKSEILITQIIDIIINMGNIIQERPNKSPILKSNKRLK